MCKLFYLIEDINVVLPSVAITINFLTTTLHPERSFHLKLRLNKRYSPCAYCSLRACEEEEEEERR